ncbi:glycosyltransferase family 2 protein [Halobacteriovorax sp. HLS]|uniref:glycosyltransferase family 2 protein n=1 Tax=Halobacteriovorax sp. HLS TaxID=2234000 RepID=UPI000FD97F24|nr:glycosyltransferase family 2 protein [Halobacteriovorax sp. HLS]
MLISIIATSMNEFDTIDEFISRVDKSFENIEHEHEYEIIFIDDRSTDGSLSKIENYCSKDSRIKLILMSRNFGRHECFFAGFEASKGDAVVTLDSDLQDPPELIPRLLDQMISQKSDVVHSIMKSRAGESSLKLFLTSVSYSILKKTCTPSMPVNSGYFKISSRRVVDEIIKIGEVDSYFKGFFTWVGFNQSYLEYDREARSAGETQFSIFGHRPYKDFLKAVTSYSYMPLYLITVLTLMITLISILIGIFNLISNGIHKYISIIVSDVRVGVILLMGSAICFILSIIGLYLIQIHSSTRGRPRYIVEKSINLEGIK